MSGDRGRVYQQLELGELLIRIDQARAELADSGPHADLLVRHWLAIRDVVTVVPDPAYL